MATFQNTLMIHRPVDDVFAFLADFENVPTWNYAIVETKKTSPGPVGVGTTYRQLRSVPDRSEEGFEVTAFEPTTRLEVHGDIGPFTATVSYLLAPVGGGTRLINVVDLESASGALRLLAPLATSRVKAAVAANLHTLRELLEAGGRRDGQRCRRWTNRRRAPRRHPRGTLGREDPAEVAGYGSMRGWTATNHASASSSAGSAATDCRT